MGTGVDVFRAEENLLVPPFPIEPLAEEPVPEKVPVLPALEEKKKLPIFTPETTRAAVLAEFDRWNAELEEECARFGPVWQEYKAAEAAYRKIMDQNRIKVATITADSERDHREESYIEDKKRQQIILRRPRKKLSKAGRKLEKLRDPKGMRKKVSKVALAVIDAIEEVEILDRKDTKIRNALSIVIGVLEEIEMLDLERPIDK